MPNKSMEDTHFCNKEQLVNSNCITSSHTALPNMEVGGPRQVTLSFQIFLIWTWEAPRLVTLSFSVGELIDATSHL